MINFTDYVKASTLEEAWNLNQSKRNRVIGGMLWLRLENLNCATAIDLSNLGLDQIEENDEEFRIGAMVTLHELETNKGLHLFAGDIFKDALHSIVGVQFRNLATVGGTVHGKFGFSDLITLLLSFDTTVVSYKGGEVKLEDYLKGPSDRDILTHIIIKKTHGSRNYQSVRAQKTDFPTLTCCIVYNDNMVKCVYGARPGKATVLRTADGSEWIPLPDFSEASIKALASMASSSITTGSNLKGSASYRSRLVKGLTQRALQEIGGQIK